MTGEQRSAGGPPTGPEDAQGSSSGLGAERLASAAAAMRQHTDRGWEQVRGEVVASAMRAFRPSSPVRGLHADGPFTVASEVVVAAVRRALEPLPEASADGVSLSTGDHDRLERIAVSVVASYGSPLLGVAEEVRRRTAAALEEVLGRRALVTGAEAVVEVDVHIGGVEVDPRRL